ncbi:hypothetical protein [Flavobacterium aestivum]|uniref:hypothetical protein n=1 Tax=Flavobacterium aestivum TaxID=3003257 RepID=UPI002482624C|nr:hypothetical protein [Flavobacterium aestivum]
MSIDHNRIKVADLETNQPNKILTTNTIGELEFSDINNIKTDSYNALDYTIAGKALDARQGKILQDTKENSSNKTQDIESNKTSNIFFGSVKAIYDWSMGKFKKKLLDIKDITNLMEVINGEQVYVPLPTDEKLFYSGAADIKILLKNDNQELVPIPVGTRFEITGDRNGGNISPTGEAELYGAVRPLEKSSTAIFIKIAPNTWHIEFINTDMLVYNYSGISWELDYWQNGNRIVTTNDNPITLNLRTNSVKKLPIGCKIEYTQKGNGIITLVPFSGVTLLTNSSLSSVKGETKTLTKIAEDTWTLEGNLPIAGTRVPRTYYINGITGNNAKGVYEDSTRPYLTVDYVLTSANFKDGDIIFLETPTTFAITAIIPFMNCTFKSDVACTLTLAGNNNTKLVKDATSGHLMFDIPNGTLDLRSSVAKTVGEWFSALTINAYNLKSDATFNCNIFYAVNLKILGVFTHNGGTLFGQTNLNGTNNIFINGISSSATSTLFASGTHGFSNIEFNNISCSNSSTYYTVAQYLGNGCRILHGNISCTYPSSYTIVATASSTANQEIIFKNQATVTGKGGYWAYGGITNITGYCTFTNNDTMFFSTAGARTEKIQFYNATIFSKGPIWKDAGRGTILTSFNITFINCTIYVDNALIYGKNEILNNNQEMISNPAIRFIGTNVVYCTVSTANYISFNNGNGTYSGIVMEKIGSLTTNGLINNTITVNNLL